MNLFGSLVSTLASYLINWGYNAFFGLLWNLRNLSDMTSDIAALTLTLSVRARLHQASASTLQSLCDDTSNSVLIEINEDTWKWVANPFWLSHGPLMSTCKSYVVLHQKSYTGCHSITYTDHIINSITSLNSCIHPWKIHYVYISGTLL